MERRKIFIAQSWIDVSTNIQTKELAYRLSEEADVWYFTQARIKQAVLKINDHLTVLEWPNKRPTKLKDLFFCLRQIQRLKPDTVIVHFGATKVVMLASWLMRVKNRIPWYHTLTEQVKLESGNTFRVRFNLVMRTFSYWFATRVVVLNRFAVEDAVKNQHIARKKIVIIPNGLSVPVGRKEDYDYKSEALCFLYVGRMTRSKGSDFIIRIFARLAEKNKNIKLQMIGKGEDLENLRQLVKELGVGDNVAVEGPAKAYSEVFSFFQKAYALVVPSRIDNLPTVIIEALACGIPVIGSNVGGIPDMIEEEKDGLLCGVEDEKDWITKLEWLAGNVEERNRMAKCARDSYEAKFNLSTHVQKVVNLIYGHDALM